MNIIREEMEKIFRLDMRQLLKELIVIALEEGKKSTATIQHMVDKYNFSDEEIEEIYKEIGYSKKRITSAYPTRTFKLLLEFDKKEYQIIDMKQFLKDEEGLFAEIRDNIDLFIDVRIDIVAGTVCWSNGLDFDPEILYKNSVDIESIL